MPYVTLLQLAEMPGALELAQVASDKHQRPVAAELMELTLRVPAIAAATRPPRLSTPTQRLGALRRRSPRPMQ